MRRLGAILTGGSMAMPVDPFYVPEPTSPVYEVSSAADSGANTLRQVLSDLEGDTEGGVVLVTVPHIFLRRTLNQVDLTNVAIIGGAPGSVAPVINGASIEIEDSTDITVANMRFYHGVPQFSDAQNYHQDSASFRSIDGLNVHNCTFAFGHDGNMDSQDSTRFSFHHNMVIYGLDDHARSAIIQGFENEVDAICYNNFWSTFRTRPLYRHGNFLHRGNISFNQVAEMITLSRSVGGMETKVDVLDNEFQRGNWGNTDAEVLCLVEGSIEVYSSGNNSYLVGGGGSTWSYDDCDTAGYVSGTQLNNWNTYGVPADELDLADVGPAIKNDVEQRAIDEYNTPATSLDDGVHNPSEVLYDVEQNATIVGSPDFIFLGPYSWDSGTAELNLPIDSIKNFAKTVDCGAGTFISLTIEDLNGTIILDISCECGTDLRDGTTSGSHLLDGTNIQAGSIMETGGELVFDLSPVTPSGDRVDFRFRLESSNGGKCIYDARNT